MLTGYYPTFFWILLLVVFGLLEAATISLVSIWFCLGAVAAIICSLFVSNFYIQSAVFVVVTILSLLALRPLYRKLIMPKTTKTNADQVIGKTAIVTSKIDNIKGTGQVAVSGTTWRAKAQEDNEVIHEGELVQILEITGVSLIVSKHGNVFS